MNVDRLRAVLFDLDGTLVDSEPMAAEAFAWAFQECGGRGEPPVEQFFALAGSPFETICVALDLPTGMPTAFRQASHERMASLRLFAGIGDLLAALAQADVAMGVITGKDRPRTEQVLRHLGIDHLMGAVVTPDDTPRAKPSPEGVWWLCAALGVSVQETVLVGDSMIDMQAGRAAGVATIGSTWGVSGADRLVAGGADHVASTVEDLTAHLVPAVSSLRGKA